MAINLSSYTEIETALFVKMTVEEYRAAAGDTPTTQVLTFSNYYRDTVIGSDTYLGVGNLLNVGASKSEIRSSTDGLDFTISGVPQSSIAEIVNSEVKGSSVEIKRVIFDATTGEALSITGNPVGRFYGIVNNYSINEEYDIDTRLASYSINFSCSSYVELLENKFSGRKTNPSSMKNYYPTDTSFDRVPNLVGSNFNFGAQIK